MAAGIHRNPFRNHFEDQFNERTRSCCGRIHDVISRIFQAVQTFFVTLFRFIFCIRITRVQDPMPQRIVVDLVPPERPFIPIAHPIRAPRWEEYDFGLGRRGNLLDGPVNLERLKEAVRNGQNPPVSSRMTTRDFIVLIDEFPNERVRIGRWAEEWAQSRAIKIDPAHPYFEIFQRAFEMKDQIGGGIGLSNDYTTYSINHEHYHGWGNPLFCYIINSLMGFQELSREENLELMRKLDNQKPTFNENPAYQFARALSKIYAYPTRPGNGAYRMDINDKLQIGISAPMEAFQTAKAQNKVLEYFQKAFDNRHCFDFRVSGFQDFIFNLDHPNIQDFSPNIVGRDTTDHQILEYFRVFKNRQIFRFAREQRLGYQDLKREVEIGIENPHTNNFNQNHLTRDQFALYLEENHLPVREKIAHPIGQDVHIIPQQDDWQRTLPKSVKKVPLDLVPEQFRRVGAALGVLDPDTYEVRVYRIIDQRAIVNFSETKNERLNVRLMDYRQPWKGTEYRKEIELNLLPIRYRRVNAEIGVKDPAVYQVKVLEVAADGILLDFRGEPIPRARWERCLEDNAI